MGSKGASIMSHNEKVNLLFVSNYYPHFSAGVLRITDFARNLVRIDHDVHILSNMSLIKIFKNKGKETIDRINIYRSLCLGYELSNTIIDPIQILSTFLFSLYIALRNKINYFIVSVPPGTPGIGAFFAAKFLRKKIVFDIRDEWEDASIQQSRFKFKRCTYKYFLKKFYTLLYSHATFVITVTPTILKHLNERGVSKAYLVPNGSNLQLFYPRVGIKRSKIRNKLGLASQDFIVVYAGVLGGYYRVDVVLEAVRRLQRRGLRDIKFVIVGDFDARDPRSKAKRDRFLRLPEELSISKSVVFTGCVPRQEAAKIIGCSDLGVIPYDDNVLWASAYSSKLFDYMASGLPIIASAAAQSDLADLIGTNKIGFIVKPLSPKDFSRTIQKMYLNDKLRSSMGKNALKLAKKRFDKKELARLFLDLLSRA